MSFSLLSASNNLETEEYDPEPKAIFSTPEEYETKISPLKIALRNKKNLLNRIEPGKWKQVSHLMCLASSFPYQLRRDYSISMASMAWIKMQELIYSCELKVFLQQRSTLKSLHLCEAPGAFISSLLCYLKYNTPIGFQHTWYASSLRSDTPLQRLNGRSFLDETASHWIYGRDESGDISRRSVKHDIWIQVGEGSCDFVTADGGLDCDQCPEKQEEMAFPLIQAQSIVALGVLCVGGIFILKTFGALESRTVAWIVWLSSLFDKVKWHKPIASKPCNSEVYWIGQGFKGLKDSTMLKDHPRLNTIWSEEVAEKLWTAQCSISASQLHHLSCAIELAVLPIPLPVKTVRQSAWEKHFKKDLLHFLCFPHSPLLSNHKF